MLRYSWSARCSCRYHDCPRSLPLTASVRRQVKWVIQMATKEVQKFEGEWTSGKMNLEGEDLQVLEP